MQAVIYCGGFGSRLGNKTKIIPKPILKINKIPFLFYIIKDLQRYGVKEILLLTYYKHQKIFNFVKNSKFKDLKIKLIREKKKLGTAGSLANAKKYLRNEFFLLNGDTFFNFNKLDLKRNFHLKKNICFAMALSSNSKKRFTSISTEKKSNYLNNSKRHTGNFINAGFYYVSKKIFKFIDKKNFSLEEEIFPKLILKKQAIGIKYTSKRNLFIDIGVPRDLKKSQIILKKIFNKKTVFLDRDGVINYDYGYVHKKNNFKFKKNIFKAIKLLNDNNYYVIIISNQSGIGRGYYNKSDVDSLHCWINKKLNNYGAYIDKFYFAPYYKFSKNKKYLRDRKDRKPNIGMFLRALNDFNIIKKGSFYIGDKNVDRIAAKNFKIKYLNVDNNSDLYKLIFSLLKNDLKKKL